MVIAHAKDRTTDFKPYATTSAMQSKPSICSRISSASDGSSVMNSMPTDPSTNIAWSLSNDGGRVPVIANLLATFVAFEF